MENNNKNVFEYKINDFYQSSNYVLNYLFDHYGSDKGTISQETSKPYQWNAHTYGSYYSKLFDHCRGEISKLFECGIGTNNPELVSNMGLTGKPGASLRAWRDYFENAEIYGADIDKKILFRETRIKTFYVDQADKKSVLQMWKEIDEENFNLIIDDGLHTFSAAINLFELSIDRLKSDGIYIIEDAQSNDLLSFKNYFDKNLKKYNYNVLTLISNKYPKTNNNLIEIRKINESQI